MSVKDLGDFLDRSGGSEHNITLVLVWHCNIANSRVQLYFHACMNSACENEIKPALAQCDFFSFVDDSEIMTVNHLSVQSIAGEKDRCSEPVKIQNLKSACLNG